ncbi:MAG: hypothetical protein ACYSUF_03480 [Planctomycetota bacterium]
MDQFTEATQQTWLSRVTGSIKGVRAGIGWAHSEITEVARSLEDLPQSVVETLQRQPGGRHPREIEEIRYEGVPLLYEAEVDLDGRAREIVVRPNGELVQPGRQDVDGDASDGDSDDDDSDDDDIEDED